MTAKILQGWGDPPYQGERFPCTSLGQLVIHGEDNEQLSEVLTPYQQQVLIPHQRAQWLVHLGETDVLEPVSALGDMRELNTEKKSDEL